MRILYLVIISALLSCKDHNKNDRINFGKVYFVLENIDTTRAVSCSEFLSTFQGIISLIELEDSIFKEQMIYNVDFTDKIMNETTIDVRYRIEFDSVVICIDQYGDYSFNNEYKGKFKGFKLLQKYIEENKENSKILYDGNG